MSDQFNFPASTVHQGKGVYLALDTASGDYWYNVLDLKINSQSDSADWNGYRKLSLPAELCPAGMSLVRNRLSPITPGYFQVLSDQQYVYLVRSGERSLYIHRYILVSVPSSQVKGEANYELQPAWEARFQRSGSADVPASDKDTLAALDMENNPFIDPIRELPLGGFEKLEIAGGAFTALFTPTNLDGQLRWQFFVVNKETKQLYSYSFARGDDGWFDFAPEQINTKTQLLMPDAVLDLKKNTGVGWSVIGPPAATVYLKQETFTTSSDEALKARQSARVLVCAQVQASDDPADTSRLATLDFAVAANGTLAFLEADHPQGMVCPFELGEVMAAGYTVDFDGAARADIPTTNPLTLGASFTLEAWIYPTAADMERHGVIGGAPNTVAISRPPTLVLQDKLRVGMAFGDGTNEYRTLSVGNVLTPNAWAHVAASFDGTKAELYINGVLVELEDPNIFAGKIPANTPIAAIGGGTRPFLGSIDEVKIWDVAYSAEIAKYMYQEIPADVAPTLLNLKGYWPLNEGYGTVGADLSSGDRNAALYGAAWAPSTSPVQPATQAKFYLADTGLSAFTGVIQPSETHPNFGNIKESSRPCLFNSADGLVHLYYQGGTQKIGTVLPPTDEFLVAHYDTSMERAYYQLPWVAQAEKSAQTQTGLLLLTARQAGAALNQAVISVTENGTRQADWTLDNKYGMSETWKGVPRRLRAALNVLGGNAISEPTDQRLKTGDKTFYDYVGERYIGYREVGDPLQLSSLLFLSRNLKRFYLGTVAVSVTGDTRTVQLSFPVDESENAKTLIRTMVGVGAEAATFIATLDGVNSNYDYNQMAAGDTKVYGLRAGSVPLLLFVPDPAITGATITVKEATSGDASQCDVSIDLTPAPGSATWTNVPRAVADFIKTIANSTTEPEKSVAGKLQLYTPGGALPGDSNVENAVVSQDAGCAPFLGLFALIGEGIATGTEVDQFTLTLGKSQGAKPKGQQANLANGSNLFAPVAQSFPDNGYPAQLDLSTSPLKAGLFKPGVDGGWLAESPRNAVSVSGKGEGLSVDLTNRVGANPLSMAGDFTLESWVNVTMPGTEIQKSRQFPRILHASLEAYSDKDLRADADKPCYMLGLSPTYALQIVKDVLVSATDASVNTDLAAQRLFPNTDFTVQLLLNPNLATITAASPLWAKVSAANSAVYEKLQIGLDGKVTYTASNGASITSDTALTSGTWNQVTLVRTKDTIQIYFGVVKVAEGASTPLGAPQNSFTLGNGSLEMRVNQLAIWTRALTADEVAALALKLLPSDTLGLNLLWRLDNFSQAMQVPNSAIATGSLYDTIVQPPTDSAFWSQPGLFYRAFATSRHTEIETEEAVVMPDDWTHIAALYNTHYGLALSAKNHGDCGNDSSLNMASALSVEAWVLQGKATPNQNQALLSKFGAQESQKSYEFGLDGANRPYLSVRILGEKRPNGRPVDDTLKLQTFTSPTPIASGNARYLVGSVEIVPIEDDATKRTIYSVSGQVYVDGVPQLPGPAKPENSPSGGSVATYELKVYGGSGSGRYPADADVTIVATTPSRFTLWRGQTTGIKEAKKATTTIKMPASDVSITAIGVPNSLSISTSDTSVNLGRSPSGVAGSGRFFYQGTLSDVRLWNTALRAEQVADTFATKQAPTSREGLISAWYFEQQQGSVAYDKHGDNDAQLTASDMWTTTYFNAALSLLINGKPVSIRSTNNDTGGYGRQQLSFGTMTDDNEVPSNGLNGTLDEVRVWNGLRTLEQIQDNLNRYLVGNEPGLAGYWRFDAGSGKTVIDSTGQGNNAVFFAPKSAMPPLWVESKAPVSNEAAPVRNALGGSPTIQTAKIQDGPTVFEYADSQRDVNGALFSVMKRAYIYRQADTLIPLTGYKVGDLKQVYLGQVQTKPTLIGYMEGAPPLPSENLTLPPGGDYTSYYGISSVGLDDSDIRTVTLTASRQDGRHVAFNLKGGFESESDAYVGLGWLQQVTAYSFNAGASFGLQWSDSSTRGKGTSAGMTVARNNSLANRGAWEPADPTRYLNDQRRFIPANEGYALVKSSMADVYSLHLANTGAMVGMSVVPNLDIPPDINLLFFPINPTYVKNGTLDGRVGLATDPNTTDSYFKPVEAYSLKERVERETSQLGAYYGQFDAAQRGKSSNSSLDETVAANPIYDWSNNTPRKDLVDTYVWTAAGGTYAEQQSVTSMRQETEGGSYTFNWDLGAFMELHVAFGGAGFLAEANLSGGTSWTTTVQKDKQDAAGYRLEVTAEPTAFLGIPDDAPGSEQPVPGKVDAYRFLSFYLAPNKKNRDVFFDEVIDPQWLKTSSDTRAAALREAKANSVGKAAWRVLHRVTYVSRVPPRFQVLPTDTVPIPLSEPSNLEQNQLILELVALRLSTGIPSPADIGEAIDAVLSKDLVPMLPWWETFYTAAQVTNSPEWNTFTLIRSRAFAYINQFYKAKAALKA